MSRAEGLLFAALKSLAPKPDDHAKQSVKRRYSEQMSQVVAQAFAAELRERGLDAALPAPPGAVGLSGAERRLSGGIGAKKVDVSWATDVSGLMLGISVKTINFRDGTTHNFQKNFTNRRGDMLIEAVTLHRRFPYAVLAGFLFLDWEAANDQTKRRRSTWHNAHQRSRLFTRRQDPTGREEQYERLYLVLVDANPMMPRWRIAEVGRPEDDLSLSDVFDDLVAGLAVRNFDFYEADEKGNLKKIRITSKGEEGEALE